MCKRSSVITAGAWVAFIHLGALDRTLGIDRLRRHLAETSPRPSMDNKFDRLRRAPGIQQWLGCGGSSRHHNHRSIFFSTPRIDALVHSYVHTHAYAQRRPAGALGDRIDRSKTLKRVQTLQFLCFFVSQNVTGSRPGLCVCFDRPPHKGRRAKHAPMPSVFIHSNPVLLSADFQ